MSALTLTPGRSPAKSKHSHSNPPPAPPRLGHNAKSLDDLLAEIKDEYIYNTRVNPPLYGLTAEFIADGAQGGDEGCKTAA
jgi:hypothetical protein